MRTENINLSVLLGVIFSVVAFQSCNYEETKTPVADFRATKINGVTFAQVESQVFATSCNSCHTQQSGPDLTNFTTVQAKLNQIKDDVFTKHSMPKTGSLSNNQLALLNSWIEDGGTIDGVPANQPPPPPLIKLDDLTYANLNAKIFKPQCGKCHATGEGVDLTTYDTVKANLAKVGIVAVGNLSMPPKTPLNVADRGLLNAWINAGAPETSLAAVAITPTYASIDANIFQPLCMNCHGTTNLKKRVPLEPYADMMAALIKRKDLPSLPLIVPGHSDQSFLFEIITTSNADDVMPPPDDTGLDALPQPMIDVIQKWIDTGAPQN